MVRSLQNENYLDDLITDMCEVECELMKEYLSKSTNPQSTNMTKPTKERKIEVTAVCLENFVLVHDNYSILHKFLPVELVLEKLFNAIDDDGFIRHVPLRKLSQKRKRNDTDE